MKEWAESPARILADAAERTDVGRTSPTNPPVALPPRDGRHRCRSAPCARPRRCTEEANDRLPEAHGSRPQGGLLHVLVGAHPVRDGDDTRRKRTTAYSKL